jgi:hypothetical protein
VGFEGINRKESPSRGVGKSKRWLQPSERRSQPRHVSSPNRTICEPSDSYDREPQYSLAIQYVTSYLGGHCSANDDEGVFSIRAPHSADGGGSGEITSQEINDTPITRQQSLAFYDYQQPP